MRLPKVRPFSTPQREAIIDVLVTSSPALFSSALFYSASVVCLPCFVLLLPMGPEQANLAMFAWLLQRANDSANMCALCVFIRFAMETALPNLNEIIPSRKTPARDRMNGRKERSATQSNTHYTKGAEEWKLISWIPGRNKGGTLTVAFSSGSFAQIVWRIKLDNFRRR